MAKIENCTRSRRIQRLSPEFRLLVSLTRGKSPKDMSQDIPLGAVSQSTINFSWHGRFAVVNKRNKLPRWPRTYATVDRQPRHPVESFHIPRQRNVWRTDDSRPDCLHCGRSGHMARYCHERRAIFDSYRSRQATNNSTKENKWIIVCTDYLSRFAVTKVVPTAEAEEIVLKNGAPRTILTDRCKVFESKLVKELHQLCTSKNRTTIGYHPQTNGLTERFKKTLVDMLSMYVKVEQTNWNETLPFVTFACETGKKGYTPLYLLHSREAETTLDIMFPYSVDGSEDDYVNRFITRAEESRQLARIRTLETQIQNQI
ncbi:transposon Ty3-I Gag-Pol polyprotein [Trichonephila clavipes]|nr:transposon Ty3-I Gag-Pol polyprotein [Trichonephila clavipes]